MAIDIPAELRTLYPGFVCFNIGTGTGAAAIPASGGTPITLLSTLSTADAATLAALVVQAGGSGLFKGVMGMYLLSPTVAVNYTYTAAAGAGLWPIAAGAVSTLANYIPIINPQLPVFLISGAAAITDAKVLMFLRNGA